MRRMVSGREAVAAVVVVAERCYMALGRELMGLKKARSVGGRGWRGGR